MCTIPPPLSQCYWVLTLTNVSLKVLGKNQWQSTGLRAYVHITRITMNLFPHLCLPRKAVVILAKHWSLLFLHQRVLGAYILFSDSALWEIPKPLS